MRVDEVPGRSNKSAPVARIGLSPTPSIAETVGSVATIAASSLRFLGQLTISWVKGLPRGGWGCGRLGREGSW